MEETIRFQYLRSGNGYVGAGGVIPQSLSRHHMISYPFMLTYWVATLFYLNRDNQYVGAFENFIQKNGIALNGGMQNFMQLFNRNLEEIVSGNIGDLNKLCWAHSNLFIGPAGKYRDDDPSQKVEECPLNMDKRQKGLSKEVIDIWSKHVSSSRIVGERDQYITVKINMEGMGIFVPKFFEYLNYTTEIYVTGYDEWAVVLENSDYKALHTFWINENAGKKPNITKNRYKFVLREKAAAEGEKYVCITGFEGDRVWGIEKNGIDESQYQKKFI